MLNILLGAVLCNFQDYREMAVNKWNYERRGFFPAESKSENGSVRNAAAQF